MYKYTDYDTLFSIDLSLYVDIFISQLVHVQVIILLYLVHIVDR